MKPSIQNSTRFVVLTMSLVHISSSGQDQETFRSGVKEIRVPVVVTDAHGHRITGLKASDFAVFEDGTPERIVAFSAEKSSETPPRSPAAAPAPNTAPAGSGIPAVHTNAGGVPLRTYLIIVDTLHMAFGNFGQAQRALGKFFAAEPSGDAQYVLVTIGREARVIQDSTRDPSIVLAALRDRNFSKAFVDSEANDLARATDQFVSLMRTYCEFCACSPGSTTDSPRCPAIKPRVPLFITSYSERAFYLNQRFLQQLAEMTRATARMPTSRTIIFMSDGFNRFPGRELYGILSGFGPIDRSFQFGSNSRDLQPELETVLKVATRDDVKFYTIDSRGLYTQASIPGTGFSAATSMDAKSGAPDSVVTQVTSAARDSTDALSQLARETGGMFFENSNDLVKGIRQAVADGREYYVVSYVASNKTADGTYRKILVTVKDRKWKVQAKPGYWAAEN